LPCCAASTHRSIRLAAVADKRTPRNARPDHTGQVCPVGGGAQAFSQHPVWTRAMELKGKTGRRARGCVSAIAEKGCPAQARIVHYYIASPIDSSESGPYAFELNCTVSAVTSSKDEINTIAP
jgi:hypothetical protein